MANILDIFRTRTGKRLLEKSRKLTGLDTESLQKAFVYTLPVLLSVYQSKGESDNEIPEDLIKFIENGNLTEFGKQEAEFLLSPSEEKIILDFFQIIDIKKENFEIIFYISAAVISIIISEIKEKRNAEFVDIIRTLRGTDTKYDENFVKVLIKNPDDANIIENSEELSLNKKKDEGDPSILGGYAGGR